MPMNQKLPVEPRPQLSHRRKPLKPSPDKKVRRVAANLTKRHWQMLCSIPAYGGMLPGYLLAMLHAPPQLAYSLNLWVKQMALVQLWMARYTPAYLDEKVKYLRFLKQLNQLSTRVVLKKSTHIKLWTWWEAVTQADPEAYALMMTHRRQLQDLEQTPVVSAVLLQERLQELQTQPKQDAETNFRIQTIMHLFTVIKQQETILSQYQMLRAHTSLEAEDTLALTKIQAQLQSLAANQWLTMAITNDTVVPAVFADRPQYPSDFVSSWVAEQLQQLVDTELVEVMRPNGTKGYSSACFYLSRKGRRQVAKHQHILIREVPWKPVGTYAYTDLEHRLAQSQFRVALTLAAERQGYTIEWIDTGVLEKLLKGVTVALHKFVGAGGSDQQIMTTTKGLRIPDDFVWIDTQHGWTQPLVIELDNASEIITSSNAENTIAMKYRTWSAFCQQGLLKQYFSHCEQGVWHLMVTTGSEQRLRHLQAAAMDVVGKHNPAKDRYWFCCLQTVKPSYTAYWEANIFTEPLWLRGDRQTYQVMEIAGRAHDR